MGGYVFPPKLREKLYEYGIFVIEYWAITPYNVGVTLLKSLEMR